MPGFPGAAWRAVSRGEWASFQASACSRPPDPTRSTFTSRSYGYSLTADACRRDHGRMTDGAATFRAPAEAYDRYMGAWSRPLAAALANAAGIHVGDRVLDVGCGTGA